MKAQCEKKMMEMKFQLTKEKVIIFTRLKHITTKTDRHVDRAKKIDHFTNFLITKNRYRECFTGLLTILLDIKTCV